MEQTATICGGGGGGGGGQVWKDALSEGEASLDKKVKRTERRRKRKIQICEFARSVAPPLRSDVGCCEQRKYHDGGGA